MILALWIGCIIAVVGIFVLAVRSDRKNARRVLVLAGCVVLAPLTGCSSDCLKIQRCSDGIFGQSCSMVCQGK